MTIADQLIPSDGDQNGPVCKQTFLAARVANRTLE
jgi:hypothetical protein